MEIYREAMRRARREYLTVLMDECCGSMSEAARVSGVYRTHLYKIIQKHAPELLIDPERLALVEQRRLQHLQELHDLPRRARGGNAAWKALDQSEAQA